MAIGAAGCVPMEKRFDAMDKSRRGALSVRDIAKLMDPRDFNP